MIKKYFKNAERNLEQLSKGAFLTVAHNGTVNTMTIAWGSLGFMWGKSVMTVLVRASRYTHEIIEKSNEFTVSIPYEDMQKALTLCGTISGRDGDKFKKAGLKAHQSRKAHTPFIDCRGMHYECVILSKTQMDPSNTDPSVKQDYYPKDDYHTIYFAQIINIKEI